jgi:hypothetical protein
MRGERGRKGWGCGENMINSNAISIYLSKMEEVKRRLSFSEQQLSEYDKTNDLHYLENSILHLRKALESIAYASIAPNKKAYSNLRASAEKPADFRKDYNGSKILKMLALVNKDFYPRLLEKPKPVAPNNWHFERKENDILTKKRFERVYDRLGKFLHSDNPWDNDKGYKNIAKELPVIYSEVRNLLSWHFTVIRDEDFEGVLVIEFGDIGTPARAIPGKAKGEFIVK